MRGRAAWIGLLAAALLGLAQPPAALRGEGLARPRLLIAERDAFTGLPVLRARYAAGNRPSDDLPGWALSYLLSGDESFARRALDHLRGAHPPARGGSSLYLEYLKWALAFDWLYGWPGFEAPLEDRVAGELVDGAARMLALPSLAAPAQASYHNHTVRELALAVFALAAVEGHPSVEARAAPLRRQAARALDNDHLDTNHFAVYRKGHLALDSGADYTDTESPHYLNYYRRTVAHNTLLVHKPGETFFWSDNRWPAANDGGQRLDSSRFWNSVRSREEWQRTRDLWDRGRIEAFDPVPDTYTDVRADGARAYHPSKLERFVRELAWLPRSRVLLVLDRVRSTDAAYRKTWLLHGVGLVPGGLYDLQLTSGFAPGGPAWRLQARSSDAGVLQAAWSAANGRLRVRRLGGEGEPR